MAAYLPTLVTAGLYISGVLLLGLAILSFWKLPRRMLGTYLSLTLFTALWAFGYSVELAAPDVQTKLLMRKIEFLGFALIPALWFVLVCQYTEYKTRFTPEFLIALFFEPVTSILLLWTNGWHHLIYKNAEIVHFDGLLLLTATPGMWYWVHLYFSAFLMTAAVIICAGAIQALRKRRLSPVRHHLHGFRHSMDWRSHCRTFPPNFLTVPDSGLPVPQLRFDRRRSLEIPFDI